MRFTRFRNARLKPLSHRSKAGTEGFEPPARSDRTTAFKTAALNHSATYPKRGVPERTERSRTPLIIRTRPVTCSRHLNDWRRSEVGASRSRHLMVPVSAGYPRAPHGSRLFSYYSTRKTLIHLPPTLRLEAGESSARHVERNGNEKGTPTRPGQYRKRDSNPHYNDFESLASTNWATPAHIKERRTRPRKR